MELTMPPRALAILMALSLVAAYPQAARAEADAPAKPPRNLSFPKPPPSPLALAASILGVPRYDRKREAIVVPYIGEFPAYTASLLKDPDRVRIDFAAEATIGQPQSALITGHPVLRRWAMEQAGPKTVRVTLFLARPATVHVHDDAVDQELRLSLREEP